MVRGWVAAGWIDRPSRPPMGGLPVKAETRAEQLIDKVMPWFIIVWSAMGTILLGAGVVAVVREVLK